MIRLAITVEGPTERGFANQVIGPHLQLSEVYTFPILLGQARGSGAAGGNVSVERVALDMSVHYHRFDFVTSLVDFYGFKDKGTRTVKQLEQDITQEVSRRTQRNWDGRKVIPYIQRHEFEGLLFSQVSVFHSVPGANEAAIEQLDSVRHHFPSPEDINDGPDTAPSKRISLALPDYDKRIDGPSVAQAIGLTTIRRECPRFNCWLTRLESLAA